MKERFACMMAKLEKSRLAPLVQFIKFGLVGVSNTLISYAVEMLGYYVLFSRGMFAGVAAWLKVDAERVSLRSESPRLRPPFVQPVPALLSPE